MAFIAKDRGGNIEVVVSHDSCVRTDDAGYKAYLKSFLEGPGDEGLLGLEGTPTRFVMKKQLSWQEKQRVRSKNIKVRGKRVDLDVNYTANLVRLHIVDIKNPPDTPATGRLDFTKEGDGYCSMKIMNDLDASGAINDLLTAVTNATTDKKEDQQKKS